MLLRTMPPEPDPADPDDRTNSLPHPVVAEDAFDGAANPNPLPSVVAAPSCRPTSRPMTYPAPKPTTETSTTTPADMTHVSRVGLMKNAPVSVSVVVVSASRRVAAVRFFLAARAGRVWAVDDAARLVFSVGWPGGEEGALGALELDAVRAGGVVLAEGPAPAPDGVGGCGASAMSSDSGTRRSSIGCELGRTPTPAPGGPPALRRSSGLGRPRAAAAQVRRVVREARRAASLSAWYEGDMKFGEPRWERVWAR